MSNITQISSRDNASYKQLKSLLRRGSAYRDAGLVWIEGEHLCRALVQSPLHQHPAKQGERGVTWVLSQQLAQDPPDYLEALLTKAFDCTRVDTAKPKVWVLDDALMASLSPLDSAGGAASASAAALANRVGALLPLDALRTGQTARAQVPTVVLDGLQDPGNVGSVLRSAAAFGFAQVLALNGTAALWSPKVLRSGMGAHFSLHLVEAASAADVQALQVPLLLTSSHNGAWLHQTTLPWPCAWVLGHEGQGVSSSLQALPHQAIRITQPGGQESLNVAAAAAICLHASAAGQVA